jgi:cell fate (sporulation/competence/biofilm development) regulator YlbF (YheA/YmcA/DUF963 family)
MEVYDTVNKLAKELKETEEYINFKNARKMIQEKPDCKEKIAKFEGLRYQEQLNSIQNGVSDENKIKEIQNLYREIIEVPEIKQYFDAELKFNILLGDVNKIISEAVKDVIS